VIIIWSRISPLAGAKQNAGLMKNPPPVGLPPWLTSPGNPPTPVILIDGGGAGLAEAKTQNLFGGTTTTLPAGSPAHQVLIVLLSSVGFKFGVVGLNMPLHTAPETKIDTVPVGNNVGRFDIAVCLVTPPWTKGTSSVSERGSAAAGSLLIGVPMTL
jgi:hypothetical protein